MAVQNSFFPLMVAEFSIQFFQVHADLHTSYQHIVQWMVQVIEMRAVT